MLLHLDKRQAVLSIPLSRRLYRSGGLCAFHTPAAEMPHSGSLSIRGLE